MNGAYPHGTAEQLMDRLVKVRRMHAVGEVTSGDLHWLEKDISTLIEHAERISHCRNCETHYRKLGGRDHDGQPLCVRCWYAAREDDVTLGESWAEGTPK